jgi:hypothetical protein
LNFRYILILFLKMNEINSKSISGFPDYSITRSGEVISFNEVYLPKIEDAEGYWYVYLEKDGKKHLKYVHQLVAEAFIPNIFKLTSVGHLSKNIKNNHVKNLNWELDPMQKLDLGSGQVLKRELTSSEIEDQDFQQTLKKIKI